MQRREASINEVAIAEADRQFYCTLGRRPADYPGRANYPGLTLVGL